MIPPDVSDQLRQAGLRVTAPRQSVLQWLVEHPHATVEQTTITTWCAVRAGGLRMSTAWSGNGRA